MRIIENFSPIESLVMCSGVGDFKESACVVAQAAILDALTRGETLTEPTDKLDCACPVLRVLAIGLNDIKWWESDRERTETLLPLIEALLDSRVGAGAISKRAYLASGFAEYAAESAKSAAKSAAKYVAESAKSAAKSAAKYAEYAEYAAESAAKYAEYAEYAAEYAAKYAAESAKSAAKSAKSAKSAESAAYAAESAAESAAKYAAEYVAESVKSAESAEYAAESAAELKELRTRMLECFWACEARKDEVNV